MIARNSIPATCDLKFLLTWELKNYLSNFEFESIIISVFESETFFFSNYNPERTLDGSHGYWLAFLKHVFTEKITTLFFSLEKQN